MPRTLRGFIDSQFVPLLLGWYQCRNIMVEGTWKKAALLFKIRKQSEKDKDRRGQDIVFKIVPSTSYFPLSGPPLLIIHSALNLPMNFFSLMGTLYDQMVSEHRCKTKPQHDSLGTFHV